MEVEKSWEFGQAATDETEMLLIFEEVLEMLKPPVVCKKIGLKDSSE